MSVLLVYYILTSVVAVIGGLIGLRTYIQRTKAAWAVRIEQDHEHVLALNECTKAIGELTKRLDYTSSTLSNYGDRLNKLEWQIELTQNRPTFAQTEARPPHAD